MTNPPNAGYQQRRGTSSQRNTKMTLAHTPKTYTEACDLLRASQPRPIEEILKGFPPRTIAAVKASQPRVWGADAPQAALWAAGQRLAYANKNKADKTLQSVDVLVAAKGGW